MSETDLGIEIYNPTITVSVYTAACSTDGCIAAGEAKQVIVADGSTPLVICGDCGQQITNLTEDS